MEKNTGVADVQPIYNAARECARLFEAVPEEPRDQLRATISACERRFRSWVAYLGVFAHETASLDTRLKFEPEIRDLVLLLLDVLYTDLRQVVKNASRGTQSRRNALSKGDIKSNSTEVAQLIMSTGARETLDGIDGSIDRLHRLAVRIRTSSKDELKLGDRVANFAKQLIPHGFEVIARAILKYKFPTAQEGLITKLTESIVFRRHRLLYQRHHYKKLSHVRDDVSDARESSSKPMTEKPEAKEQPQDKVDPGRMMEEEPQIEVISRIKQDSKMDCVSQTEPTAFRRDRFEKPEEENERRTQSVFTVGSSWVGKIDYPKSPEAEGTTTHGVCQFCFQELQVVGNKDPKWWEKHVDRDMDHYICLSNDCQQPLYYFNSFTLWLKHMDSEHEPDWPQCIYPKKSEWRCTLSREHNDSFLNADSLGEHLSANHLEQIDESDLELVVRNSELPKPRDPDICPLCEESINNLKPPVLGKKEEKEQEDTQEKKKHFRRRVVRFAEQCSEPAVEPEDEENKSHDPYSPTKPGKAIPRMAKHIAKHLKSVSFLSLRGLEPEGEEEQGSYGVQIRGSNHSALDDTTVIEYMGEDRGSSISQLESWNNMQEVQGDGEEHADDGNSTSGLESSKSASGEESRLGTWGFMPKIAEHHRLPMQSEGRGSSYSPIDSSGKWDRKPRFMAILEHLLPSSEVVQEFQQSPVLTTDGTATWFWDEKAYYHFQSSKYQLLTIQGIVGTGKTGYAKIIRDNIAQHYEPKISTACVYCKDCYKDYMDIIMSLCPQLIRHTPRFIPDAQSITKWEHKLVSGANKDELKMDLLRYVIAHIGHTILIIDGLDVIEKIHARDVAQCLRELQESSRQCKIIVTFRPYQYITRLFPDALVQELGGRARDVSLYIYDRLQEYSGKFEKDLESRGIIAQLTWRCGASFLVAKLKMDEIREARTLREVEEMVWRFPSGAIDAYDEYLSRLAQLNSASQNFNLRLSLPCQPIQAIFWVAYAAAPITHQELRQALGVDVKSPDYSSDWESFEQLDLLSGKLLSNPALSPKVRMVHKTVTKYLQRKETRKKWFPSIKEHIYTTLITYLMFSCMKRPLEGSSSRIAFKNKHPLLPYAIKYWGHGLQRLLEVTDSLNETCTRFLTTPSYMWNEYVREKMVKQLSPEPEADMNPLDTLSPGHISGLHWVVYFDLPSLFPIIYEHEEHHPVTHPVPLTPLGLAIALKRNDLARKMIQWGTSTLVNGAGSPGAFLRLPLCDAIYYGNEEMTTVLLQRKADLTLRHPMNDESPLDFAYTTIFRDRATWLADFISTKKEVNAQELQYLIKGAFPKQLWKAIRNGININQPCENGKKALDYAYELDNAEIITVLTDNGATTNLVWPPFQYGSLKYLLNFKEPDNAGPAIIACRHWGEDTGCVVVHSRGQDWTVNYGESVENALDDTGIFIRGNWRENIDDHGCYSTSKLLVELTVTSELKLPIQTIVFETVSRDQGRSTYENKETYIGAHRSWIDMRVDNQGEKTQPLRVQTNVQASEKFRLHTNVWHLNDMKISSPLRAQAMNSIRQGSKLQIFAHAAGGVDWKNLVSFVQVRIYGAV